MATTTSGIAELYADVVADLIPYYDNMVLLPNPQLIVNQYNLTGAVGNTVKIPLTNAWTAGSGVGEGNDIISANTQDFDPTSVSLSVNKKGAGTLVNEEALEDGGFETVRNAVVTRLSRSIAQETDKGGFNILASGADTTLANTDVVDLTKIVAGGNISAHANVDCSFVMSPEAMAYAVKREPTVKMFEDIQNDQHQMVATVRNGFVRTPNAGNQMAFALIGSDLIGETTDALRLSLDNVSEAVARLRSINAPTDDAGFFASVVSAAHEFHLAKELNGVGGISSGSIGSISQDLANQALLEGLIGQAVGCRFYRSNNVPSGITAV